MASMRTLAVGLLAGLVAAPAHASLIGDTVGTAMSAFYNAVPASAVVTAGIEFGYIQVAPGPDFTGDVDALSFTLAYVADLPTLLGGVFLELSGLDFTGAPAGITGIAVSSVGITGIDAADVAFTADSISLDISGLWRKGDSVTVTFDVTRPVPVPEPASLALLGAGLVGLAGAARRRRATATA